MEEQRRVLIATPTLDGKVDVWYCDSLLRSVRKSIEAGIFLHAIYPSYDSLLQRSRNSMVKLALEQRFDDLIFVDSDVEWEPEWIFKLLENSEPVIGGALVKKSDEREGYTVKITNKELKYNESGSLIEVDAVGTGFLKISRLALLKLWDSSTPYFDETGEHRMIFDITIAEDGELISEDYTMCNKWKALGYKVWLLPDVTCNHLGIKKWKGNFKRFLEANGYQ